MWGRDVLCHTEVSTKEEVLRVEGTQEAAEQAGGEWSLYVVGYGEDPGRIGVGS